MLEKRRLLLKTLSAALFSAAAPMVAAQAPDPQPQLQPNADEQSSIAYMAAHGISRFTLLNKLRGKILFIEDGQIVMSESALSGKIKGDKTRDDFGTTPAGIHILRPFGNGTHIGFKQVGENIDYSIHTMIDPPGENRPTRLASNRAEFKRISSGCVNVSQPVMNELLKFVEKSQQVFKDDDGMPYVMGSFFVVLPEKAPLASILKYPEFTLPKGPENN